MACGLKIALVSSFPPGRHTLNEYGYHLARGLADDPDVSEIVVLTDHLNDDLRNFDLGPKARVRQVWNFNSASAMPAIVKALRDEDVGGVVYNLETASFSDREALAALGMMTPAMSRLAGIPSGVIAHCESVGAAKSGLVDQIKARPTSGMQRAVVARALASASYLTTTAKTCADRMKAQYPKADITLMPYGGSGRVAEVVRPSAERPMRVVISGQFGAQRQLEPILSAIDHVRRMPDLASVEMVVCGTDHPCAQGYMEQVALSRADDPLTKVRDGVSQEDFAECQSTARLHVADCADGICDGDALERMAEAGVVPILPYDDEVRQACELRGIGAAFYELGSGDALAAAMMRYLMSPDLCDALVKRNLAAVQDTAFSDIAKFHVDRISQLRAKAGGWFGWLSSRSARHARLS